MAIYPCAYVPHRYFSAQQTAYYTSILDHSVRTYRARLCPPHFTYVCDRAAEVLNDVSDAPLVADKCEGCGDERLLTVQIKLYPLKQEMVQLVADLCATCATKLETDMHVRDWEPLPER